MSNRGDKFKLGMSFFWQFLAFGEDPNHPREWKKAIPDLEDGLEQLKAAGITHIEIKSTANIDLNEWKNIVRMLLEKGFQLTFHASGRFTYPSNYQWVIEDVRRISEMVIKEFDFKELLWIIHPLHDTGKSRALIFRNNQAYLQEFLEVTKNLPVKLALENLRNRDDNVRVHVGDSYQEMLTILDEFENSDIGICWDFGHACAMEELGLDRKIPPPEFLQNVIHCHIHDCEKQVTHLPPGKGRVPWQEYLKLLYENEFRGILNIEAVPYKLKNPETFLPLILESVELIKSILARLS